MKTRVQGKTVRAVFEEGEADLKIIRCAAYVLTDRAYAHLEEVRGGKTAVELSWKLPKEKNSLKRLAADFKSEIANQVLRHAIADNGAEGTTKIVEAALAVDA